jgi:hypothetical protein
LKEKTTLWKYEKLIIATFWKINDFCNYNSVFTTLVIEFIHFLIDKTQKGPRPGES